MRWPGCLTGWPWRSQGAAGAAAEPSSWPTSMTVADVMRRGAPPGSSGRTARTVQARPPCAAARTCRPPHSPRERTRGRGAAATRSRLPGRPGSTRQRAVQTRESLRGAASCTACMHAQALAAAQRPWRMTQQLSWPLQQTCLGGVRAEGAHPEEHTAARRDQPLTQQRAQGRRRRRGERGCGADRHSAGRRGAPPAGWPHTRFQPRCCAALQRGEVGVAVGSGCCAGLRQLHARVQERRRVRRQRRRAELLGVQRGHAQECPLPGLRPYRASRNTRLAYQAEPQAAESDENRLFPKQADSHGISHTY